MEILVVGLGAIGSIYALILRQADPSIKLSFVARSNYDVIKAEGIHIDSAKFGTHVVVPDAIYRTTAEAASSGKVFDYIFCTTKALPNAPTEKVLGPAISATSTIVLIQNGLGIEQPVHEAFPENTIISCTAYIGVWQTSPGTVKHSALERLEVGTFPDSVTVMEPRRSQDGRALAVLLDLLAKGGSVASAIPSMPAGRWQKLIWNASFNCVCTITGFDTNMVTQCEDAKTLVISAMREIISASTACGYPLSETLIELNWENTRKMGVAYKPSMLLDYEAGREMELDVILGAPISAAEAAGVDVPTLKSFKQILDILNWKTKSSRKPIL